MTTAIPPAVFAQITQTSSCPEDTVALLNAAEERHSSTPKHLNAKRVYPFWKICTVCLQPFQCHTKEQATRNLTCGPECNGRRISQQKIGRKTKPPRMATCRQCGAQFEIKNGLKRADFCGNRCYGDWRASDPGVHEHLQGISSKGRSGWTAESLASYSPKMSGANNPAWKGGVTYFKTHGNYVGVKYVRCPLDFVSMARKDGYVMEHRLLVAQAIGRPLLRSEAVHHIDHDPTNNSLSNLQLFASNQHHKLYEHRGSPVPIWPM